MAVISAWEPAVSSHTPPWAHLGSMEIATHASKSNQFISENLKIYLIAQSL